MDIRHISNPDHPAWRFARFAVTMVVFALVLAFNANDFDETEITTLLITGGIVGSGESLMPLLIRVLGKGAETK